MSGTMLWALLTGMVSGAAWVGIVLLRRQYRLIEQQPRRLEELHRRLDHLDALEQRLADVEQRLEFTERLVAGLREGRRLPPPGDGPAGGPQRSP